MSFQLNVDERVQEYVVQKAQRLNVEPQRLFDQMLDGVVDEDAAEKYITVNDRGTARISGRRIKVAHLAIDSTSRGLSPMAIANSYHLSLAQVHAALAYYYDHQEEVDAQIEATDLEVERLRNEAGESPFVKRMRAEGRIA